ncbi:hypothetical protein CAPTEDRAFT_197227 [Capitella teleta]|uniref:Uncharacterized protein n=1 Tax=Capitella teleta TaxID=283909 RepID=R7U2M5_CAPTE|nr:hypothetical protein CAPTEDRAFT_197227 [Capitella teleta]|eukprot:ELU00366.1 hypothetical protein CAPTEDRAFT_197227 [Capitella teleta]
MPTDLSSDVPSEGTSYNTQLTEQEHRDKILDLFNYLFTPDNTGSANHGGGARRPTATTSDFPRERTHVTKQEQRDKILELQTIEKLTAMKKCQPADHEVPPDGPNSQELRRPGMPTELSSDVTSQETSDNIQLRKQKYKDKILDLFNYLFTPNNTGSANHGAGARRPTDTTSDLPRERTHVTKQEQRDKILELQIIEKLTAMKKCQPADHEVPPDGPNSQELRRPGMPTELRSDVPSQGTSDNTQLRKQERRDKILDLFNYLFTPDNASQLYFSYFC